MSQDDQVLSVRLRRKNTGTPWGFRMHGGAEFGTPIHIQHVNPKSLAYRQGLRVQDRLLAVGNAPTHSLSHEQVKMEIIRAGNELDFVVQRNPSAAGVDQQDSRPARRVQQPQQYNDPDEEPSEYRGYTNPKVQSRSFKILQESLSYTEADEEGTILPSGHIPGEGIVLRAYNEGKRRMQELAEINPRNFIAESPIYERGQNLLKCSEEDEEIIAKLKCSWKSKEPQVASSKSFTPSSGGNTTEQTKAVNGVDLSGSSVLAPAAAQQKYLQQAHAYYGDTNAPVIQITSQPGVVYKTVPQPPQQAVQQPITQTVQSTVQIPVQATTQKTPRRRERKRQPKDQQAVSSPVAVTQASGFIPTTDTVSSVAEELNLKHESTVERQENQSPVAPKPAAVQEKSTVAVQPVRTEVQQVTPTVQAVVVQQQAEDKAVAPKPIASSETTVASVQSVKPEVKEVQPQSKSEETVQTVVVKQQAESGVKQTPPQSEPKQEETVDVVKKPMETDNSSIQNVDLTAELTDISSGQIVAVKAEVDTVDATIELTNDVIREYGERMAETVISESLQDANQSIKDSTDGTSESNLEQMEDTVSSKDVKPPTNEVTEKSKNNEQQEPKPEIKVAEKQQVSDAGKSESKPVEENLVAKIQPEVEHVDKPVEQVAPVENSKNELAIDKETAKEDSKPVEISAQIGKEEVSRNEVKAEKTPTITETTNPQAVEAPQDIEQVSKTVEDSTLKVQSSEQSEVIMLSQEVDVSIDSKTSEEIPLATVEVSEDNQSENVEISIAQTEGSFVVGETEESSFVFQVQEGNEVAASEDQSQSFDISISEGTEESANITLDLSADVTIDSSQSEDNAAEVSISLDTNESEETVIVQEGKAVEKEQEPKAEKASANDKKEKEPTENKASSLKSDNNKKDNGPPKKAKFVDSQGGVSARLARFNLKKK